VHSSLGIPFKLLGAWGVKSQIGTNFEICVSKFSNSTNFESSHKFMYRKIGINNYIDMTKFENDADIRYLLTRYISVILPAIRYQTLVDKSLGGTAQTPVLGTIAPDLSWDVSSDMGSGR
jgi:hypothetical protein